MIKEDFVNLYKNDNKTGKYSKENHVIKNFPDIYSEIINYSIKNKLIEITFKQKVFHYANDIKNLPICKECGKYTNFLDSTQGYRIFCSEKCGTLNIDTKNKFKETCIKKYGVDHPKKSDIVKEKYKNTCLDKYGVVHISKTKEYKEKYKNTCLERYGVENTFQYDKFKEKSKNTFLEKYDVEHALQNKEIKNKQIQTSIDKYGGDYNITSEYRDKFRVSFKNKFKHILDIISISDNNECECKCDCGKDHIFTILKPLIYNRVLSGLKICNVCYPTYYVSGAQIKIKEFIENYISNVFLSDRKTINGELDIYLPELKLAFEFNGLWWHNELYKDKNYHLNKTEECEKLGIQLIHIWEDDWIYKQDIVKSIIINKLNKTPNKIFARKTIIKEINDNKLIREFLDKNHIQGFVGSKVKLGLFFENELVSLMTFGNRRVAMGKKTTNIDEYELLRFCNKLNTNVIGGASKLFKYFINNYKPKEITTYADRSISQGKLYETLGFISQGKTEPNYYYINNKIRQHRFNFRKDVLVKQGYDANKTEHDIMLERKIFRIYDSGNLKYSFLF